MANDYLSCIYSLRVHDAGVGDLTMKFGTQLYYNVIESELSYEINHRFEVVSGMVNPEIEGV